MAKEFNHDSVFEGTVKLTGSGALSANQILIDTAGDGTASWGAIPSIALTDVSTAVDQTAHLALANQEEGDVVIRTDESKSYVHNGGTAGTMADWTELLSPTAPNTNLGVDTITVTTLDITSSTGTDVTIPAATASAAGLMTKAKFDEVVLNNAKVTNVSTDLSIGTKTATTVDVNSSDGTNATIPAATATEAGLITATQFGTIEDVKSVRKVITTAAGGAGTVIAHTLGTANLHVSTYDSAGNEISTEVHKDATNVTITTAAIETNMEVIISTAPNITTLV